MQMRILLYYWANKMITIKKKKNEERRGISGIESLSQRSVTGNGIDSGQVLGVERQIDVQNHGQ